MPESDVELLSAYLDNQLSVAERVSLERRLEAEPQLRAEIDELRATAALLRGLEPVRPPRSFTLDPATAPRRAAGFSLAWVMQLSSGLAGLALVLLATVQLLAGGVAPAAPAPAAMEAPAVMSTMAPAAMATAAPASEARQADAAPTEAGAAAMESVPAPMAATEAEEPEVAGGQNMGGATSLPPGAGGDLPSSPGDATSAAADEAAPAQPEAQARPAARGGLSPGITLAIGAALLAAAIGWRLYARR